ncbi:MAG TPA: rod shape-determining protein, partial [Blastocatellia bacterium]|nr:rod shape-determining protein [Blastocatellia bacterium]
MICQQIIEGFIHRLHSMPVAQNARGTASMLEHVLRRVKDQFRQTFSNDLVIELGTSNTVIYVPDQGIVLNEPTIIAFDDASNKIVAVGREAKLALGRQASTIRIVRPVKEGVIADFDAAEIMLTYFIKSAMAQRKLYNPRVLICAPSEISEVERRAFEDAAGRAGARYVDIIEAPLTAALGAGFDVQSARVFMIIDIGGGTTDIAVLGYGGPVHLSTLRVGGSKMDEAIIQHMRHNHCLEIGELTAEAIKIQLGSYGPKDDGQLIEVRGRDLKTGLPALVAVA